jgi:hypothetical protein
MPRTIKTTHTHTHTEKKENATRFKKMKNANFRKFAFFYLFYNFFLLLEGF